MGGRRLRTTNSRHRGWVVDMMGTEYEGRKLDLEELLELSEGDSLQICYGSVYAETPQTIEAGCCGRRRT